MYELFEYILVDVQFFNIWHERSRWWIVILIIQCLFWPRLYSTKKLLGGVSVSLSRLTPKSFDSPSTTIIAFYASLFIYLFISVNVWWISLVMHIHFGKLSGCWVSCMYWAMIVVWSTVDFEFWTMVLATYELTMTQAIAEFVAVTHDADLQQ